MGLSLSHSGGSLPGQTVAHVNYKLLSKTFAQAEVVFVKCKTQNALGSGTHIREVPAGQAGEKPGNGRRVGVWLVSLISADRIPGPAALHKPTVGPPSQSGH